MKNWAKSLIVLVLIITLIGCSANNTNSTTNTNNQDNSQNENPGEMTKVSFSYWGSDFDRQRMESIREEFYQEYSNIEVELVQLPGGENYVQKQMAMMAAGAPYDVVQLAEESYQFAARGTLEDLSSYVEKDNFDLDQYFDVALNAYTHKDKLYGIPMRLGASVMYYNKNLFDQHGLDYPNDTWTWDDAITAAKTIRDPETGIFGFDRVGDWWASYDLFLQSFGGSTLTKDLTQFNLDSPESIEAIELMQSMIWETDVSPSTDQVPEGIDMWTSGLIGMKLDGPWHIISNQENITEFDWDIAVVPQGATRATPTFSSAFHMAKASNNKDAAWEVIKFWTGKQAQEILAAEHGDVPTMKEVANSPLYLDLGGLPPENFGLMIDSVETAFAPQTTLVWSELNDIVSAGMNRMLDLNNPIDEIIESLRSEIEPLMEEAAEREQLFQE